MNLVYGLVAAIAVLQAADVTTTAYALKRGLIEANPIARRLFRWLPMIPAAVAAKLVFSAPIIVFALAFPTWWPVPALYAASLVLVVAWNVRSIRRELS